MIRVVYTRVVTTSAAVVTACWLIAAQALPGFVSGELLKSWCSKNEGLDREACYSYLRGASDAFHAMANASAQASGGANVASWPNKCMPARISITDLRDAYLEFAAREPHRLEAQAAVLLAEVLEQSFPCAKTPNKEP